MAANEEAKIGVHLRQENERLAVSRRNWEKSGEETSRKES